MSEERNREISEELIRINKAAQERIDANLKSIENSSKTIDTLLSLNQYTPSRQANGGSTSFPLISLDSKIKDIERVQKAILSKGPGFIASQFLLHFLNPRLGQGKIFNPAVTAGPPPFTEGLVTNTLDVGPASRNPGTDISKNLDELGKIPSLYPVDGLQTMRQKEKYLNIYSPDKTTSDYSTHEIGTESNTTYDPSTPVPVKKIDYGRIFKKYSRGPSFGDGEKGANYYQVDHSTLVKPSSVAIRQKRALNNSDSFFNLEDFIQGYTTEIISETDAIVPFYFEDLRSPGRYLYFRAFLTEFSEMISPNRGTENFYGRVEPVKIYMSTDRSFSVSFKIASFSPQGLSSMWKKINNFCKMAYPSFKSGILHSGPMVRMKIGDVCSDGQGRGLPGFISSLSFSYTDSNWEIGNYSDEETEIGKVPMVAEVSFSFDVIHENNPSVDENYRFDTQFFRRMGTLSESRQLQEDDGIEQQQIDGTTDDSETTPNRGGQ